MSLKKLLWGLVQCTVRNADSHSAGRAQEEAHIFLDFSTLMLMLCELRLDDKGAQDL